MWTTLRINSYALASVRARSDGIFYLRDLGRANGKLRSLLLSFYFIFLFLFYFFLLFIFFLFFSVAFLFFFFSFRFCFLLFFLFVFLSCGSRPLTAPQIQECAEFHNPAHRNLLSYGTFKGFSNIHRT